MKRKYCITLESDLIDRIQVLGNPYLTLDESVEIALEHVMECENDTSNSFEELHG
jgi:hypothetical protein